MTLKEYSKKEILYYSPYNRSVFSNNFWYNFDENQITFTTFKKISDIPDHYLFPITFSKSRNTYLCYNIPIQIFLKLI